MSGTTRLLLSVLVSTAFLFKAQSTYAMACHGFYEASQKECSSCNEAMVGWYVVQPAINLHLDDTPLFYSPSRGLPVQFRLSYRQRDQKPVDPDIFGVGTNWTSSGRVFLVDATGIQSGLFRLHRGGASEREHYLDYYLGAPQFYDGSILSTPDGGQTYQIEYPDGAKDVFAKTFVTSGNEALYFLTSQQDPSGNTLTYNYASNPAIVRLLSITDPDGRSTSFYYENSSFTNQITKVEDPFSRNALLQYDASGFLTNIVDVVGITSSFVYDAGPRRSWITNLITPYGTTVFRFDGVNADTANFYDGGNKVNRSVEVTLPNGGRHLYLYRQDGSAILSATSASVPNTSPFGNTLDNVDLDQRNSFHWEPIQFVSLSTNYLYTGNVTNLTTADYVLAGLNHWLIDSATGQPSRVLSRKRAPSTNGEDPGQVTWLDYPGKTLSNSNGVSAVPLLEARVLPDSGTHFQRAERNHRGWPTNEVSTYTAPDGASFVPGSSNLRTNTYLYDGNGIDLLRHVGPDGHQIVSNHFNAYHQPLISYNALDEATVYTYNGNRQLTSVLTPAGLTTANIYFASGTDAGRLDKTIDLEIQRTNSYTYYPNGLVWSHTDERGLTTYSYWDNLQRRTGTLFPDGTTTSNRYTLLDITATKDRLGHWSYASFNPIRLKTAETSANGVITGYGYCDCGALLSVTNALNTPAQMVTRYGYDRQGNRTYTYLPDATITNWYDSLKRLVMTGDAWGYEWYTYNNQGLRVSTSNSFGAKQITVYDVEDRPLYVLDANGVALTNSYDELGRLNTRTYPDGGVEHFGYSARGLVAYTNQLGTNFTFYAYDEARRKIFETNANSEVIRYTNSAAGDLIALVDGKNQVTKWKYDEYGRVTNKLDQAGTEILRYQYDSNNRLTNRWSVAKGNTGYAYDAVGNLTNINYPGSPDITMQYDPLNRLTNRLDAVGTNKYSYASGGQLWTEDGPFADDTVTNTYNNRLRVNLALQQPTGVWTNAFGYDAAKRLTSVTSQAGSFGYLLSAYQPSILIHQLALPNSSYITNEFDANARLLSTALKNSFHSTINSHTYSYNPGNQRTQQVFSTGSTYNYTYDSIGQLKVADSGIWSEDRAYDYDPAWNLTNRVNVGVQTFQVDGLNQLTNSTPGGVCTYDGNGNLVSSGGGLLELTYDDENRLSTVQSNIVVYGTNYGLWKTLYSYDGVGRLRQRVELQVMAMPAEPPPDPEASLIGKQESKGVSGQTQSQNPGGGHPWGTASITEYVYDGWRVIQERNGSNNVPTVSYTRGTDLSGSLEGAGGIGGLLARSHAYSSGNWTNHNYYHADGNGNVTYLVSSSQTLAARYRYDPYGNVISSSGGAASANEYRFSSKMVHAHTGLYYYGYRWYAPNLQRWLNRDPLGDLGFEIDRDLEFAPLMLYSAPAEAVHGANLYVISLNNTIGRVDPAGLQSCPVGICIPIPCPPGITFVYCVQRCALARQGIPIGPPLCLACFGPTGITPWVGCPCSGVFRPRRPR